LRWLAVFVGQKCILKWCEVNWHGRVIEKPVKMGKKVRTRITPAVEAILRPLIGHDSVFVFTYVAERSSYGRVRGKRCPITSRGLETEWRRTIDCASIRDLRFHDLRHDFGTRVQRACGNIKITQRALNHSRIESTLRYINVRDDEVVKALEDAQTALSNTPTNTSKAS
jgi:integrase